MEEQNKKSETALKANDSERDVASPNANKIFYIVIGIAILLISVVWIWRTIEIGNIKKQAEKDSQTLKEAATKQILQSHEAHLQLLAKSYVWAVRAEMMQGNISQVNLYANDMVKEKNFQRIAVANDKGIIVSSTNKKDEGQLFLAIGKDAALSSNNTSVENVSDSILIMTSPVMEFNNRIGTLLIKYAIPKPKF